MPSTTSPPSVDSRAGGADPWVALYRRAHAGASTASAPFAVLQLGAEQTRIASGQEPLGPSVIVTLALGYDKTARDFFRSAVPTPLQLETAIASVEDEIHAARRPPASGQALHAKVVPWSADPGLHELATLAGIARGPVRVLPLDAMERLFNRLAAVSEGRPAAHEGLPESAAFAARLLVLRELMHHVPFDAVTLVDETGSIARA